MSIAPNIRHTRLFTTPLLKKNTDGGQTGRHFLFSFFSFWGELEVLVKHSDNPNETTTPLNHIRLMSSVMSMAEVKKIEGGNGGLSPFELISRVLQGSSGRDCVKLWSESLSIF